MTIQIHPTADVSPKASIGEGTRIWHQAQVRPRAKIGQNCIISKAVFIDAGVTIGNNVKIQNYVSVYYGVTIEDGVFVGPHVCFTNDIRPRSINPDTSLKAAGDWILSKTLIRLGASIGANSTILCGISVGAWAMIGAGSVVTHDIPDYGLVWGNPARLRGFVCPCGGNLKEQSRVAQIVYAECQKCSQVIEISSADWELAG
jgi:acetyltransferase-like isoleucine patch superfamily enzyme